MAGPTGSGKSDLALLIAEKFDGEIINCDSLQVYRHFDIGTAKLPLEERRGIPHHLIDILDPNELCTAGAYARLARNTKFASENLCAWLRESALTNTILPETTHNAGGAPRRPQL